MAVGAKGNFTELSEDRLLAQQLRVAFGRFGRHGARFPPDKPGTRFALIPVESRPMRSIDCLLGSLIT